MRTAYSFSILRYVHDPVTQEFVNIGVALYSRDAGFLRTVCTSHYSRITNLFTKIDGNRFRQLIRYLEDQVNAIGASLPRELPFEPGREIEQLLARVLPPDDSSFQFSTPAGVGLTANLEKTLAELFERYVERYDSGPDAHRRNDEDVWKVFREPLEKHHVAERLTAKKIIGANYDYEFQRAWKNRVWHVYEPVSFDMVQASSILEKANRWVGRASSLSDASEAFEIHLLLGEPQDIELKAAFEKAQNILKKMPGEKELIRETDVEAFAAGLEREMLSYSDGD